MGTTLRQTKVVRFSPAGLSDSLDETDEFPGACAVLQNLIPDPSTRNVWTTRPASIFETDFSGFTTPGFISVFKVIGDTVYGMIASGRNAGHDEPFAYNVTTNAFVAVSNILSTNVPVSPATTGDWVPPTMDLMGVYLIVTHPGFDGVTNFIGWFDLTTIATPVWNAGNFTLVSPVITVGIAFPGSGYTPNGTYNNIPLLGGIGSGATANITVSGNHVTAIAVVNGGLGYNVGDVVTVDNSLIGGGTGFVGIVATVGGSGILTLAITASGSGYTSGYYPGTALDGGSGTGATANMTVVNGSVVGAAVVNQGTGYHVNDILTSGGVVLTLGSLTGGSGYTPGTYSHVPLLGGSGTGMFVNITVNGSGVVSAVTVVDGGAGYKASDTLTVPTGGAITALTTTIPDSNKSDGTYANVPQTYATGSGRGAKATLVVSGGLTVNVVVTSPGHSFAVNEIVYFNSETEFTVASVTTNPVIGPGSGFSVPVATVTTSALGSGSGFTAQVVTLSNPGGYINFTTVPTWVRQFNQRAWFGINPTSGIPSVIFTDVLALNCTNANQALTFGNDLPLVAGQGLGLSNQLGGIIQSLMVFQDSENVVQITGDAALNTLAVNSLNVSVGTVAPRSITPSPLGIFFLAKDGYRVVGFDANISPPIGLSGTGVIVPLENALYPTRINACCNGAVLRVSVQRADAPGNPWQEFWYDLTKKVWSGPHTFPTTMIDMFEEQFLIQPQALNGELFTSAVIPTIESIYRENGEVMTWIYQTVVLANTQEQGVAEIQEFTVNCGIVPGANQFTVMVLDANGNPLPYGTVTRTIDPSL